MDRGVAGVATAGVWEARVLSGSVAWCDWDIGCGRKLCTRMLRKEESMGFRRAGITARHEIVY